MKKTGIYKITNKLNGKVYIGQSTDCERRINEHRQTRFIPIDMWINMIGAENFDFEIIEECNSSELDAKEKEYISQYNSIEEGYNSQIGGFNNSIGEGNGRAAITEEDVKKIRRAYNEHHTQKETYKNFEDKISFAQFQRIWQGNSWSYIMPEVYTQENKDYYVYQRQKENTSLTLDEVLNYRKMYVDHTRDEVYNQFLKDKGLGVLKKSSFIKILVGDVRETSIYNEIPVYKKTKKQWELKGNPVSTIPESGE